MLEGEIRDIDQRVTFMRLNVIAICNLENHGPSFPEQKGNITPMSVFVRA